jgi:hypothetical protein
MVDLLLEIDRYLLSRESRERRGHYASDIASCMRQLYYKWTNTPESNPINPGGYWKMSMGEKIHDLVHEFLLDAGYDIINEVSGSYTHEKLALPIHYRVDNLFIDKDGMLAGLEVKTTYGAGMKMLGSLPKSDHLAQVAVYMHVADIRRFYVLYIARDNGSRRQFLLERQIKGITVNGVLVEDPVIRAFNRLITLEQHVEARKEPEREFRVAIKNGVIRDKFQKDKVIYRSDWQCMYCRWRDYCWAEKAVQHLNSDNAESFG